MVEAVQGRETRAQIRARIKERYCQTFDTMTNYELKIEEE